MSQTYAATNLERYSIGAQIDIAVDDTSGTSSNSTNFFSVKNFTPANSPEPLMIEDHEGNRSEFSHAVINERSYPFSFQGVTDIGKIGTWIYLATGSVSSVQDGATGAYTHTYSMLNSVVLPKFTLLFDFGGEGYRRMKNCQVSRLRVTVNDSDAMFEVEGLATAEDDTPNTNATVSSLTISAAEYQSNGLIRYTFSGTPDLSSVSAGDVLNATDTDGDFSNATNRGKFIIVSVNDGSDYVDVISDKRSDATDDETGLTVDNGNTITIVESPVYATPSVVLLRRHSAVLNAVNTAGLSSATAVGLRNISFEINNNSKEIREQSKSADPAIILAGTISVGADFTQILTGDNASLARKYRDGQDELGNIVEPNSAWRLELEDTSQFLGTSTTVRPKLQVTLSKAIGIGTRAGGSTPDELTYDWSLKASKQQNLSIVLQNEVASYGS